MTTRDELGMQVITAVRDWLARSMKDPNLLEDFGGAELEIRLRYEGTDESEELDIEPEHHFEAVVVEKRSIVFDSDRENRDAVRGKR